MAPAYSHRTASLSQPGRDNAPQSARPPGYNRHATGKIQTA